MRSVTIHDELPINCLISILVLKIRLIQYENNTSEQEVTRKKTEVRTDSLKFHAGTTH